MKYCKYCGARIEDDATSCPACSRSLITSAVSGEPASDGKAPSSRKKFIIIAAALVAIAVLIAALSSGGHKCKYGSCDNKAIKGFDYCYMHKCAVSGCNNSTYMDSNFCISHYLLYDEDAATTLAPPVYSYELRISGVTISSSSSYTTAEGTLTNNSDQTVSFVKIKGSFETSTGTVIDTDWTYAVGTEGLAPGESTKWHMSVPKDYSIKTCKVTILDFDY